MGAATHASTGHTSECQHRKKNMPRGRSVFSVQTQSHHDHHYNCLRCETTGSSTTRASRSRTPPSQVHELVNNLEELEHPLRTSLVSPAPMDRSRSRSSSPRQLLSRQQSHKFLRSLTPSPEKKKHPGNPKEPSSLSSSSFCQLMKSKKTHQVPK